MRENTTSPWRVSRREILRLGLMAPLPVIVAACGGSSTPTPAATSAPAGARSVSSAPAPPAGGAAAGATAPASTTIFCSGLATPAQTEGPYFSAGSPQRASLVEPGMSGTRLTLTGFVLTRGCQPVANAKLDFWQADAQGNYDNSGFRLRGYQLSDAQGRYQLETVIPGLYPGRTEHIHVKAQAPGRPVLTTQLYFPGVSQNNNDGIFDRALLIDMRDAANGAKAGIFNFVLDVA